MVMIMMIIQRRTRTVNIHISIDAGLTNHLTNMLSLHRKCVCQNELMMPRNKRSSVGRRAFSVAAPSVWNSLADYLRDPAFELNSLGVS